MVGCHSRKSNDLSVHARIGSRGYVRFLLDSSEEDDKISHAAIFEVKCGKKKKEEGAITDSPERTADTLFNDLESVAFAIEGSDLNTTKDHFVPTAKCIIQDTKERQLVTRSDIPRLRYCVCDLHHKRAMKSPLRVRQFSKQYFNTCTIKVDVIAGDANAAAYKYFKKHQYQDLYNSSVAIMLREMQREGNEGRPLESRLDIDS